MSHRNKQDCKFPSFILVLLILFKTVLPFHANSTNLVNASKVQFLDDELPLWQILLISAATTIFVSSYFDPLGLIILLSEVVSAFSNWSRDIMQKRVRECER